MLEEKGGWFIKNVKDANWYGNRAFGKSCSFEDPKDRFPEIGVHIFVLEPGKSNCRYHREGSQENLLVLSGHCKLLVNGEERELKPWDFVHFPAGVSHVVVGGDEPAAVLILGHRAKEPQLFYPKSELAKKYNAETPEPTPDPKVAYSDVDPRAEVDPPKWPL